MPQLPPDSHSPHTPSDTVDQTQRSAPSNNAQASSEGIPPPQSPPPSPAAAKRRNPKAKKATQPSAPRLNTTDTSDGFEHDDMPVDIPVAPPRRNVRRTRSTKTDKLDGLNDDREIIETPSRRKRMGPRKKGIDLGLQGGGAHGAYAWGVLDRLLEDGRLEFEGISGASAGTMNAVVLAYGLLDRPGTDPRMRAREALHAFWLGVSQAGSSTTAWAQSVFSWLNGRPTEYPVWHDWMQSMQQWVMPFSQPAAEINPLRTVLEAQVDFDRLRESTHTHLFVSATNIRTGNIRVFRTPEITLDVAMASACLPWLFKPVKIGKDFYWDGGYLGNPPLYPFYYETMTSDILIVHINPIERAEKPVLPGQIMNRVNEITFNASLQREFRAISFVHKLIDEGWLKPEYRKRLKYPLIHSIRADKALYDLSSSTKFVTDWHFLTTLRDRGREAASLWLDAHYKDVGVRSSVDLRRDYLQHLPDASAIKA